MILIKGEYSMEIKLVLSGLNCANCASKIESKVNKINGIKNASLNFSTTVLTVELIEEREKNNIINEIKLIVKKLEPHVKVIEKADNKSDIYNNQKCNDSCCINLNEDKKYSYSKKSKNKFFEYFKDNLLLIIGAVIYIVALFYKNSENLLSVILFGVSYLIIGGNVLLSAIKNIFRGQVFDENFLMSIATIGAFFIGEYPEAVAVMLFYQIGEVFQGYAVNKSRKSISSLMNIRADYANLLKEDTEIKVSPEEVNINDVIVIKPGERVPLDGIILEGTSFIDTSALTGESIPREVTV